MGYLNFEGLRPLVIQGQLRAACGTTGVLQCSEGRKWKTILWVMLGISGREEPQVPDFPAEVALCTVPQGV